MTEKQSPTRNPYNSRQKGANLIVDIALQEYGQVAASQINDLIADMVALYAGKWSTHEACQVGYHTIDHALDVTLAVARMAAGWNRSNQQQPLPETFFLAGIAAALFHDAGYLKDKGDSEGKGGKYTFNHVERSVQLAQGYLSTHWSSSIAELVCRLILLTDFQKDINDQTPPPADNLEGVMGRMVATADLIAQMADVDYLEKINDLFEEFLEAYHYEGRRPLAERGIQIYSSAREILDGTPAFYEQFVMPRLESLGRMDRYLRRFFTDGRNPYQENITANISHNYDQEHPPWRRLGEIFEQRGVLSQDQIMQAVNLQTSGETISAAESARLDPALREQLLARFGRKTSNQRLGEILLVMKAIDENELCQGLIAQTLSPSLLKKLTKRELIFLLQAAVLVQNICQGSTVLEGLIKMTATFMECEAGAIHVFDMTAGEAETIAATGTLAGSVGLRLPLDKNLAGWVHRHGQPVSINEEQREIRLNFADDGADEFKIRSVLMAPLQVNGERIGVLELVNKNPADFSEHEVEIITCLANIIGSSLDNYLWGTQQR
jgi:hypothetical protein